jgi:hypothetical protein
MTVGAYDDLTRQRIARLRDERVLDSDTSDFPIFEALLTREKAGAFSLFRRGDVLVRSEVIRDDGAAIRIENTSCAHLFKLDYGGRSCDVVGEREVDLHLTD